MQKGVNTTVDLLEVIDAMDIASDTIRFFVNLKNGQIISLVQGENFSDLEDEEIDEDEGDWIPEHYLPLPDRDDVNKYEIMQDFCYQVDNDDMQANLLNAISGTGAFGRFKTAVHCYGIQEDWYEFLNDHLKEMAIQFCEVHDLKFTYNPRQKAATRQK
ncbi:MAG: hypothetical protein JSR37_07165 [Verrucomicrobia bacterium]|nr:hypothetical protein [Verrucomicrobiota bacterium]MBS0637092.1 hypothetical protein [Verrucomicrobiota bacterium]